MTDHSNPAQGDDFEKPRYLRQTPWHVELVALAGVSLGRLPSEVAMKLLHDEIKRREAEWMAARRVA